MHPTWSNGKLIIRVTEHKNNLRKGPNSYSIITEHALHK